MRYLFVVLCISLCCVHVISFVYSQVFACSWLHPRADLYFCPCPNALDSSSCEIGAAVYSFYAGDRFHLYINSSNALVPEGVISEVSVFDSSLLPGSTPSNTTSASHLAVPGASHLLGSHLHHWCWTYNCCLEFPHGFWLWIKTIHLATCWFTLKY